VSSNAGLAPLFAARLSTVVLFGAILAVKREPFVPAVGAVQSTLLAGVLDSFANVAYFLAVHRAPLAIVGTIVSLSPATTVLLARAVLSERWTAHQRAGLAFAMAAIVCVSIG
jgi:drug/metabolite transporter (DMT)-like permease